MFPSNSRTRHGTAEATVSSPARRPRLRLPRRFFTALLLAGLPNAAIAATASSDRILPLFRPHHLSPTKIRLTARWGSLLQLPPRPSIPRWGAGSPCPRSSSMTPSPWRSIATDLRCWPRPSAAAMRTAPTPTRSRPPAPRCTTSSAPSRSRTPTRRRRSLCPTTSPPPAWCTSLGSGTR
jgi:hypothetical protein